MRYYHAAILIALLPWVLHAQRKILVTPFETPFVLTSPGVVTRLEKFDALPHEGQIIIDGFDWDQMGFLCVRTNQGLARFDGYDLKVYRESSTDKLGPAKTQLVAMAVDGDGFIWGATRDVGLKKLDPATGKSLWYSGRRDNSTSVGTGATRLLVTSDGQLWAGVRFGLAKYDKQTDSFIVHNLPLNRRDLGDFPISSLCEIGRSIWLAVPGGDTRVRGGGVLEFRRDEGVWKRYTHDSVTGSGPSHDIVRSVCTDRTGRLWIGTRAGLDRYDPRSDTWDHFAVLQDSIFMLERGVTSELSVRVWTVVSDEFGGIWIASDGAGLFRFDPETGKFLQYRHNDADVASVPSDFHPALNAPRIHPKSELADAASKAKTSAIWIPSGFRGARRVIVRRDPCTSVTITSERAPAGPSICAVSFDAPGKIWVACYNAFPGHLDLPGRKVKWYGAGYEGVVHLCQLRDRTVLVSTMMSRAWIYVAKCDSFERFAPGLRVHRFLEDTDSLLWLGCSRPTGTSFIAAFDRKTGKLTVYPRQDADSASYRDDLVLAMADDHIGGLWYGTRGGGLIRFDLKQKTYHRYAAIPGSESSLPGNNVPAISPDSSGRLWVGTNAGLALMDCDRGTFVHTHYGAEEEYGIAPLGSIVDDGEGHLWMSRHTGAFCFTKATREFRMLTPPPRFQRSILAMATFEPGSRVVTFGGEGGFFSFSLDDPPAPSSPPPVVLTSFRVFEKPYDLEGEIWCLKSITLPPAASFFSFTFAALDYIDPGKNLFAYQLEGVDPSWVQAGSRRYVSYSNLDPGTYVFRVRGTNSEGIWNNTGTALEVVVLPPWYRTMWAYAAYILAFVGLLYQLRNFDRRRVALKHSLEMKSFETAKMRELDQAKSAFFANISHEFRTPLTLILGPLEQFAERFKHDEHAQSTLGLMRRNGLRLLQLINQLLDLSRMDAGKMTVQVSPLELVALSRSLLMSFASLAERKKIYLNFDPEENEIIAYTDRDKFEKILTNLISNALKFTGEGGEVGVVLRIVDRDNGEVVRPGIRTRRVELVVSDTGIGIDPEHIGKVFDRFYQVESSQTLEHGGTGIGLALAKELVEILKGKITVESTPGHGSTFIVRLPLGKEVWRPEEIVTDEKIFDSMIPNSAADLLSEERRADVPETLREPDKPVVLIVDDNADVRTYLREFLQKAYTIEEAENGKSGLEKACEMGIDLVISDVVMPVMDGVQLCRELKGDDRTSHIPVILLTARATSEGKLEGLEIGADDYVVKPFDARELIARVKNLIDTRRKLWEKYHQQVTLGPTSIPVTSMDEKFLKRCAEYIEQHIADADYDTEALAHDMCMSRMQLNRKLNALTGHSTHEVVREFRLQRAAELLRNHADNIAGVAYDVGFSSLSHFAHAFRERFGTVPSEYRANQPLEASDASRHRRT